MPFILRVVGDRCIACGLCVRMAPHLFTITDHKLAVPTMPRVAGPESEDAFETAAACPVEAIEVLLHRPATKRVSSFVFAGKVRRFGSPEGVSR